MAYELVITQFSKMLKNLSALMDKGLQYAEEKKFDPNVLLEARLAPDMFSFTRQIQITCDTAKYGAGLLAGREVPVHADNEQSLGELKARIDSVLSYLSDFSQADFEGAKDRKIARPRWEGKYLSGEEYLHQHLIPNFYFHVCMAYAILRHNGVNVGKKDFLGELPYKR